MVGFENFQVSAWIDGVLTKRPEPSRRATSSRPRKTAWRVVVAATVFASVAVMAESNIGVSQTATTLRSSVNRQLGGVAVSNDEVPIGYWPRLLHEIKGWRSVEETSIEPPDPIV